VAAPGARLRRRPPAEQLAALPWRRSLDGTVQVLLVAAHDTRRWAIPTAWPVGGRSPSEMAAEEACAEACVTGEASALPIGAYSHGRRLIGGRIRPVRVLVFPVEVLVEQLGCPEPRRRHKLWVTPAEAAEMVDEPELKDVIRRFRPQAQ
jgi:hypothetical protein